MRYTYGSRTGKQYHGRPVNSLTGVSFKKTPVMRRVLAIISLLSCVGVIFNLIPRSVGRLFFLFLMRSLVLYFYFYNGVQVV